MQKFFKFALYSLHCWAIVLSCLVSATHAMEQEGLQENMIPQNGCIEVNPEVHKSEELKRQILQKHEAFWQKTKLILLPAQNGTGGERLGDMFAGITEDNIIRVPPHIDFGQYYSAQEIVKTLCGLDPQYNLILAAYSQGTAALLNYLGESKYKKPQDLYNRIKLVVLEGVIASNIETIEHAVISACPLADWVPGIKYLAALQAMLVMPYYSPFEKSPLLNAIGMELPKNIPIVIIHGDKDLLTPFKGAVALYAALRDKSWHKVYFMGIDLEWHVRWHIDLLNPLYRPKELFLFHKICKKHELPALTIEEFLGINSHLSIWEKLSREEFTMGAHDESLVVVQPNYEQSEYLRTKKLDTQFNQPIKSLIRSMCSLL